VSAVLEVHAFDGGIDPRLDGHAGNGCHRTQRLNAHRDVFAHGFCHLNRHDPGVRLHTRRGTVIGPETADKHSNADQGEQRHPKEPLSLQHRQFSTRARTGPARALLRPRNAQNLAVWALSGRLLSI